MKVTSKTSSMNESQLAKKWINKLKAELKKFGVKPVVFRHIALYQVGIPDYSVTVDRVTVWLEFKKWPTGRLAKHQKAIMKRLGNGFVVWVGHPAGEATTMEFILGRLMPKSYHVLPDIHVGDFIADPPHRKSS